jgi:ATP-binding cassette, subfamily B, bacterial
LSLPLKHKKFRFFHQHESNDCGPACLAMVTAYYGIHYSVKEIKDLSAITRMGVSVQDIITGAEKTGFEATGLKLRLEDLEEIPLPAILFWKQDHFIVLKQIKKKHNKTEYHIADPGYGEIVLDAEIVSKEWMGNNSKGIAIVLEPDDEQLSLQRKTKTREGKNVKKDLSFLKPIVQFIRENKLKYVLACVLLLLGLMASWMMPVLFKRIVDAGIIGKSYEVVWILLIAQFGLFVGNFVSDFISHWVFTKVNFNLSILLKNSLLHKLMKLPVSYFDTRLNTDTLQRLNDQGKIQNFVTWKGLELVLSSLNIIVFSTILLNESKTIFAVYAVLSALSFIWISFFLKLRRTIEYSLFLRQSENSNSLYEFIMHMPEIKINNAQHNSINKIINIQRKLNVLELRSLFLNIYQLVGMSFLTKLKEVGAIAICAYLIIQDNMTLGTLLSITYILGQLAGPIQSFISYIRDAQDASIAKDRIDDVYREKEENDNRRITLIEKVDQLLVNNVEFKYPGSFNPFILNDISFNIPINKITAIVGPSGSGKSTLLKLLLSYYPATRGEILVNSTDISLLEADSWRSRCGIVLQDGHIFGGTILENIAFSEPSPDFERVEYACKVACIDAFIKGLPMGFNTKVGTVGMELSGGQKQRLLIARAVYRNPDFIFFDEATSSLDANNEKAIMNNLNEFFTNKTVVIIAHRLSTVKNADQIIVLNNGRMVEYGDHAALVTSKGNYYELVKNQLELGN